MFPDYIAFLPYVGVDILDLNGGLAVFTALSLASSGYPDEVRQIDQALRDQPGERFGGALAATGILLGELPPALGSDADGLLVSLVDLSVLHPSSLRGDHGGLRTNLLQFYLDQSSPRRDYGALRTSLVQVYTEMRLALKHAEPDWVIGLRPPEP